MHYAEARAQIKTGDLLAWSGKGPFSMMVRAATLSKYSHVGLAWWCYGRLFVLEVTQLGGGKPPRALSKRLPFDWVPTNAQWSDEIGRAAFAKLDTPYSYLDAIRAALGFANDPDNGTICTEFVRDVLVAAKVPGVRPDWNYVPNDLVFGVSVMGEEFAVPVTAGAT